MFISKAELRVWSDASHRKFHEARKIASILLLPPLSLSLSLTLSLSLLYPFSVSRLTRLVVDNVRWSKIFDNGKRIGRKKRRTLLLFLYFLLNRKRFKRERNMDFVKRRALSRDHIAIRFVLSRAWTNYGSSWHRRR